MELFTGFVVTICLPIILSIVANIIYDKLKDHSSECDSKKSGLEIEFKFSFKFKKKK